MFLGHLAVALAAKRAVPRVSLGWLMAAALFLDLLWPLFLLMGWERVAIAPGITAFAPLDFQHYPISHGLPAVLAWSLAAAAAYGAWRRDVRAAIVIGALVLSHWLLDLATHRPDLPLWFGAAPRVGLGLWNSIPATLAVELSLFALGLGLYLRGTVGRDRAGTVILGAWLLTVLASYGGAAFGPPPPSAHALALAALASFLLPPWAAWFDHHRTPRDRG